MFNYHEGQILIIRHHLGRYADRRQDAESVQMVKDPTFSLWRFSGTEKHDSRRRGHSCGG